MKKLFFPLALLTFSYSYAQESEPSDIKTVELTEQQENARNAIFRNADIIFNNLLQIPEVAAKWETFSDDEKNQLKIECLRWAEMQYATVMQYNNPFNNIFDSLSTLTGYRLWATQIGFVSKEYAELLQQQQEAQPHSENHYDANDEN